MDKVYIFDTTLRDGEQAPGATLNQKEKLEVGRALADLGVDIIEAGFAVSSKGDFESVRQIAKQIKGPVIASLARCVEKDIEAAAEALKPASKRRIHVFLATSPIHLRYKLKKTEAEVLEMAVKGVKHARKFCDNVEFSAEDASRSEKDFLCRVVEAVIKAGATTVNIPDTVGYIQPFEFGALIRHIKNTVPNIGKAVISVHCHNDLGLGVANSLEAVRNGCRQIECTVNGLGERAGNAAVEEIVMAMNIRKDVFGNIGTSIKTENIYRISKLVSKLTGFVIAPNKAVVGGNAFRHESGIHQDGVIKERTTYEIIDPKTIGYMAEDGIVLGKHSGRHAFDDRLKSLGFHLPEAELNKAFERFKDLADKKKTIFDDDLIALVEDESKTVKTVWQLDSFQTNSGTRVTPTAEVVLKFKGQLLSAKSNGDGPVDACYKAVDKITGIKGELQDYRIEAVTKGKDALGEVSLKLKAKGKVVTSHASATDIIESSVRAYLNALNKIESL